MMSAVFPSYFCSSCPSSNSSYIAPYSSNSSLLILCIIYKYHMLSSFRAALMHMSSELIAWDWDNL